MTIPDISSILLVGTENPVALPAIRSLGRAFPDAAIHTLSPETDSYQCSNYSKFVTSHFTLYSTEGNDFLRELVQCINKTGAEILIPVDENYIREVSIFRNTLAQIVKLPPISPAEVIDSVRNKGKLAEFLLSNGLATPVTHHLSGNGYHQFFNEFGSCLIKPVYGSSGYGIQKIDDIHSLENMLPEIQRNEYILQELIPGENIDCSFLAVEGKIKAYTIQKGLASAGYNFSTAISFVHNEIMLEYVQTLVRTLGYSGIAHLDFRLDSRDGLLKLIDFNGRFWFSMEGSNAAGVDFAVLYCLEAINYGYEPPEFDECIFLMGRSTFKRFGKSISNTNKNNLSVHTDFLSRLTDPWPEVVRYF